MQKKTIALMLICALATGCKSTQQAVDTVPLATEPLSQFMQSHPDSKKFLDYQYLDQLLKTSVLDIGRSDRSKLDKPDKTNFTRLEVNENNASAFEGNRFYFESYTKNSSIRSTLKQIKTNLASVPSKVTLSELNREEQLAYWINLYNVTLLDALVEQYPLRNLSKLLNETPSLYERKLVTAGDKNLSLNDIEFRIIAPLSNYNPLMIYGLYRGYIGGPNIRTHAYRGKTLYASLKDNASEFINSNRGVWASGSRLYVSSLYAKEAIYFRNFEDDLKDHLFEFLDSDYAQNTNPAAPLYAEVDNYNINDIYGTARVFGEANADNKAAELELGANSNLTDKLASNNLLKGISADRLKIFKKLTEKYYELHTEVTVTDLDSKSDVNKQNNKGDSRD